jgi:hypothetical protein
MTGGGVAGRASTIGAATGTGSNISMGGGAIAGRLGAAWTT